MHWIQFLRNQVEVMLLKADKVYLTRLSVTYIQSILMLIILLLHC